MFPCALTQGTEVYYTLTSSSSMRNELHSETRTHTLEMIRYYLLSVRHFSIIAFGKLHYQHVFHIINIIIVRAITIRAEHERYRHALQLVLLSSSWL